MTEDFNKWWDSDGLVEDNPYGRDTPVFWAWEGWQAAVKAEREECAKVCEERKLPRLPDSSEFDHLYNQAVSHCAKAIRARGQG
jgi:hypothetical protein